MPAAAASSLCPSPRMASGFPARVNATACRGEPLAIVAATMAEAASAKASGPMSFPSSMATPHSCPPTAACMASRMAPFRSSSWTLTAAPCCRSKSGVLCSTICSAAAAWLPWPAITAAAICVSTRFASVVALSPLGAPERSIPLFEAMTPSTLQMAAVSRAPSLQGSSTAAAAARSSHSFAILSLLSLASGPACPALAQALCAAALFSRPELSTYCGRLRTLTGPLA
mmetsp:Transcript_3028/g.8638  ORF Transcript_3028/g.8638 Transcript_3028/m.8638 type:complete len:228 (+) Transcript_3028:2454-3137(+)